MRGWVGEILSVTESEIFFGLALPTPRSGKGSLAGIVRSLVQIGAEMRQEDWCQKFEFRLTQDHFNTFSQLKLNR